MKLRFAVIIGAVALVAALSSTVAWRKKKHFAKYTG